jgi:hypothetical protein
MARTRRLRFRSYQPDPPIAPIQFSNLTFTRFSCRILDSIDTGTLIGLRDRALIGVMVYSFARVGATLAWIPMEGKLVNKIARTIQNTILRLR